MKLISLLLLIVITFVTSRTRTTCIKTCIERAGWTYENVCKGYCGTSPKKLVWNDFVRYAERAGY
jgi:hypothetical protein